MNVKSRQCLLYVAGYDPGPIDGVDGPKTQAAMKKVFKDYGVGEDGLVGILAGTVPRLQKADPYSWWKRIKYFTRDEYMCPCGNCNGFPAEPEENLVKVHDRIRSIIGKPMVISSGVRCSEHNSAVGGVRNSLHMRGRAVDFYCPGKTSNQLLTIIKKQPEIAYCYAIDDSYVHMDIGG